MFLVCCLLFSCLVTLGVAAKLAEAERRLKEELDSAVEAHTEASKEVSRLSAELEACMQAKEDVAAEKGERGSVEGAV